MHIAYDLPVHLFELHGKVLSVYIIMAQSEKTV